MTCETCGAELTDGAKYCSQCGAPVWSETEPQETVIVEPDEIDEAPTDEHPTRQLPSSPALPVDSTTTAVPQGVLHEQVPTPRRERRRRPLDERGAWEEFVGAIVPVLRTPRVSGNVLGAVVAILACAVVALIAWALFRSAFEDQATLLLPLGIDPDENGFGVIALLGMVFHQVPLVNGDNLSSSAPFLLVAIPIAATALGVTVARRVMPCSGRHVGFLDRAFPFALAYGVLAFVWSLFGADDWHGSRVLALVYGVVIALIGARIAERWIAPHADVVAAGEADDARTDSRLARALRTGTRVLCLVVLAGAIAWFIGLTVGTFQTQDEGEGSTIAANVLEFVEGGFNALGFGVLAETTSGELPGNDAESLRIWQLDELLPTATFALLLVAALATSIIGGLFSGFAIAREARPRSRNDHALFGALTGGIWAAAMLIAQFVILDRFGDGDGETISTFDGVETFFLALLVGGVLGALGGLLAAGPADDADAEAATGPEPEVAP